MLTATAGEAPTSPLAAHKPATVGLFIPCCIDLCYPRVGLATANALSCLLHLEGLLKRQRRPMRVLHVAEILAGYQP